jgi:hypothetical protein
MRHLAPWHRDDGAAIRIDVLQFLMEDSFVPALTCYRGATLVRYRRWSLSGALSKDNAQSSLGRGSARTRPGPRAAARQFHSGLKLHSPVNPPAKANKNWAPNPIPWVTSIVRDRSTR